MNRIKELREERGLTIRKLAELLNINNQNISRYENEARDMSTDMLKLFAKFYEVTIDYLLGFSCYYIYLKYYCSLAKKAGIKQDFTAKQFLTAIGYSTKSQKQIDKISTYNNKLKEQGLIIITPYRDELGHLRNCYKTND